MPCDYKNYAPDWKQIRAAILERSQQKCERCGVPNGAFIFRSVDFSSWYDAEQDACFTYPEGLKIERGFDSDLQAKGVKIVLTIAHANHDIQDNRDSNIFSWCQICHLRHDASHHAANAAKTRLAKKAAGSLFEETNQ